MSDPAVIVTFIRHGESTDNLRSVWAGWADAPLSNLGMEQARALGESLANVSFVHIYASDLKRATMTAQALQAGQAADPKPPLTRTPLIREQHFGIAEGKPWTFHMTPGMTLEEHYAEGLFPVLSEPTEKYPDGESTNDLAKRATQAVKELIIPHVWKAAREGERNVHVAVVSHGLCISELVPALLNWGLYVRDKDYSGLKNTAWTRVEVVIKSGKKGEALEFPDSDPPPLAIKVTHVNQHGHLQGVRRQAGGISSAAHDPAQSDIRSFFGGGKADAGQQPPALEHSKSNVEDQPGKSIEDAGKL